MDENISLFKAGKPVEMTSTNAAMKVVSTAFKQVRILFIFILPHNTLNYDQKIGRGWQTVGEEFVQCFLDPPACNSS